MFIFEVIKTEPNRTDLINNNKLTRTCWHQKGSYSQNWFYRIEIGSEEPRSTHPYNRVTSLKERAQYC
jgi:hypothetical protein